MAGPSTRELTRSVLLPVLFGLGAPAGALAAGGLPAEAPPPGLIEQQAAETRTTDLGIVGPYRLLAELGAGGMGTVYLAEQRDPVLRHVALKVAHPDLDSPEFRRQFLIERQALALVNHDHVARLYDAGETSDGAPWFAMELVKGDDLLGYCDRNGLGLEARLELLAEVADAVDHLHRVGIQHRDLKPDNVLVAERDGRPVPKIVDFGLASVDRVVPGDELVGTPTHMAPEQFTLPAHQIDPRADVHALGVMLYQLTIGALPFRPRTANSRSDGPTVFETSRRHLPRPSERLGDADVETDRVTELRGTTPRRLARLLEKTGLDELALEATAGDRTARTASAREFAARLRTANRGVARLETRGVRGLLQRLLGA